MTVYDEDYFERGIDTGKSLYKDYRWMPELTRPMAQAIVEHLRIPAGARILDVGCAKGYLVRALRELGFDAHGCDISEYALTHAPEDARPYLAQMEDTRTLPYKTDDFDWIITKDVLEHQSKEDLSALLLEMFRVAPHAFHVIPLAHKGRYLCEEYEDDVTHVIRERAAWWTGVFITAGYDLNVFKHRVPGIKDKWFPVHEQGNGFYSVVRVPRFHVTIPGTGDPTVMGPLIQSLDVNTVGSHRVTLIRQNDTVPKELADQFYAEFLATHPTGKVILGNDNMILAARNAGLLEGMRAPWQAEMDDDVIVPPGWDAEFIRAAETCDDDVQLFVPLMTFREGLVWRDQLAAVGPEMWEAMREGDIAALNAWYSKHIGVAPALKIKPANIFEYSFIVRRGCKTPELMWHPAFDLPRHAQRANEELMMRVAHRGWKAVTVQNIMVWHQHKHRDQQHYFPAATWAHRLDNLLKATPEYVPGSTTGTLFPIYHGGFLELAHANMPSGLEPALSACLPKNDPPPDDQP